MKKFLSLVCLMAVVALSAQAQSGLTKKQDSVLLRFNKYLYGENVRTVNTYVNEYGDLCLNRVTAERRDSAGRIVETVTTHPTDTGERKVYTYDSVNATMIYYLYSEDHDEHYENTYYGMKYGRDMGLFGKILDYYDYDENILLCDSLQKLYYKYDQDSPAVYKGYFTFDSAGLPLSFCMEIDYGFLFSRTTIKATYSGNLPVAALVTSDFIFGSDSVMDDVLDSMRISYNADGQITKFEICPVNADYGYYYKRFENTYADKKIRSQVYRAWENADTLQDPYYHTRSYYTYCPDGNPDTIYTYYFYMDSTDAVSEASRIGVTLSPNPVKDMLDIRGQEESTGVSIYNAEGKLVLRSRVEAGEDRISMQGLSRGMYFVRLQNSKGVSVQQLLKQ